MTSEEPRKWKEEALNTGPLSVLTWSVKNSMEALISCPNKNLLGWLKPSEVLPPGAGDYDGGVGDPGL